MTPSPELGAALAECLARHLGPLTGAQVLAQARRSAGLEGRPLTRQDARRLLLELPRMLAAHLGPGSVARALSELGALMSAPENGPAKTTGCTISIEKETDVIDARTKAISVAQEVGFVHVDAVKVATVVSELARNILQYAGSGAIEIVPCETPRKGVRVIARDAGPGILQAESILAGRYRSKTGMGLGLVGSKRIMDSLDIKSAPGRGTVVTAVKYVQR
ncbi:Putative SigmaB asociated two-component system sensor protein [Minicystis rosea]|nr:Putative SigmaB asociated two-component system sensor protein [Minicystis rosea]